ncbi:Flp pilus assembly protein CpaB [candidate division KSB1 bacterium]|nr:Flp pilus assembly protein CpaB [candidate division KSB1 bacterium]
MFFLKPKFMIPIAMILGAIATYSSYVYLQKQEENLQKPEIVLKEIVVASANLTIGTSLEIQHLKMMNWPEEIVPVGSYTKADELLNRVNKVEIAEGEPVLESKLAPEGSIGGLSSLIPLGKRAITISVNVVSGVGGFILPHTRVDVIATIIASSEKKDATAKLILENVEVLAIDQTFERNNDKPVTVQSVTLLVLPDEAEKLALAGNEGKLQLILRNSSDNNLCETNGSQLTELVAKKNVYIPVNRPRIAKAKEPEPIKKEEPQTTTVEVIRSNVRSEVSFDSDGQKVKVEKNKGLAIR